VRYASVSRDLLTGMAFALASHATISTSSILQFRKLPPNLRRFTNRLVVNESKSPGAFTVSHTSQAALTGPVVLAPRQLFPLPMQPPQMHQQGVHMITLLQHILTELDAAKQELNRVASSIEQVYNQICWLTGSGHSTVQPSHSSVHPVAIHAPEQR
jgi:hypothetical protein